MICRPLKNQLIVFSNKGLDMQRIFFMVFLALVLASCATQQSTEVKSRVEKKLTEDEAKAVKVEKGNMKTWIFEQTVKVRSSTDPSSKIYKTIEEGDSVNVTIIPLGTGWNRIVFPDGLEGFYFGKTLAREKK
jgi:hypothetical protein